MKTIVLYGMRGSGKSTIGRKMASELGYSFVDLDDYINDKNKDGINGVSTLADYIDTVGWDEFRDEEHRCLKDVLGQNVGAADLQPLQRKEGRVISLGGGTIVFERNRKIIQESKNTTVLYLYTDIDEIVRRITQDEKSGNLRNSLTGKSIIEELKEVFLEREEVYKESCNQLVDNSGSVDECVCKIVSKI